jgi:hypothetical protein
VIAQSGEIRVMQGQPRYWDQPGATLVQSEEPGRRGQFRFRIIATGPAAGLDRESLIPASEVFSTSTGETVAGEQMAVFGLRTLDPTL